MRADLHQREARDSEEPYRALVFGGDGAPALIDVNDHGALETLMDEEDRAAGRA